MNIVGRRTISGSKVPRYIRFVDDLPMTISGKVQKFVIRERMMGELGVSTKCGP